ncbi:MAG: DUF1775 domain-containing protein [Polyangiales bacterium]
MSSRSRARLLMVGTSLVISSPAWAHVGINNVGYADTTQVIQFGVGHGCEGADSTRIEVSIPPEITTLRPLPSAWGEAQLVSDETGIVTSVVWTKTTTARSADDQYYEFAIRLGVPDAPFTTLYLPTSQTCRAADGTEIVTNWAELPGAETPGDDHGEPAPALHILPTHGKGWNKYTTPVALTDLSVFDDAEIVWVGDAAYSGNPTTAELIASEEGVTPLTEISADADIWVKY